MDIKRLNTARIQAEIKELTMRNIIDLSLIPPEYNVKGMAQAASMFVVNPNLPIEEWTLQELYAACIHYNHHVNNLGQLVEIFEPVVEIFEPEAPVAPNATIADYMLGEDCDYPLNKVGFGDVIASEFAYKFTLDEDSISPDLLKVIPLSVPMALAVEEIVLGGHIKGVSKSAECWRLACVAAQVQLQSFEGFASDVSLTAMVSKNVTNILNMTLPNYTKLMLHYGLAMIHLRHIVDVQIDENGFVLLPLSDEKGAVLPPYRFCLNEFIPQAAIDLWQ